MTRAPAGGFNGRIEAAEGVVLASSSPRRQELLKRLVPDFHVRVPDIDESRLDRSHPVEHAANLAARKGEAVAGGLGSDQAPSTALLIAADTVVFIADRLLEKPQDRVEARAFLSELSGRPHTVCTALSVQWWSLGAPARRVDSATLTEVRFHRLSDGEIDWYLSTGEWEGVAGGYRLQGAGAALISSIRGSYTNVVGLPLETLFSILRS
jgi:septum formation protein